MTDTLRIDAALARALIAQQFPHWAALPVTPVPQSGWDNRTFRLGDAMSVRLPSARWYAPQVEKEQRWLPFLAPRLPLPIPAPIAMGAPSALYPWPWSIYRWLPGEMASQETVRDLCGLARDLAAFLRALQATDATDGPRAGLHSFHRGGPLSVYSGETRAALATLGDAIDGAAALSLWDQACATCWPHGDVWVHGDIAPGNLLVEAGALCAVIDFGCCAIGDPACDLAIAWTFFDGESRTVFRDALGADDGLWLRARAWALWKALITAADPAKTQTQREAAWVVLRALLA